MYAIMVNGKMHQMTNNASKAEEMLGLTVAVLFPHADWRRAARTFRNGHSVTVGNVCGLVTG